MAIASPDAFEILKQPKAVTLTNLAANPSVDSAITGWVAQNGAGTATVTRDTGTFHSTPASCKCVHTGTGAVGISLPAISAVLGDWVEAVIWINGTAARSYTTHLVQATTAAGFTSSFASINRTLAGGWQQFYLGGYVTSGATSFAALWIRSNGTFSDTFFADDYTILKNPAYQGLAIDLATDTGLSSIILPGGEVSPVL